MTALGYLYVVGLLCTSTYLAAVDSKRALLWAVALLPWYGLDMDVGLRVTAFQLFSLPIVAVYLIRGFSIGAAVVGHVTRLALFLGYALAVSVVMLPFLPDTHVAGGTLRNPVPRSLVQVSLLLFTVLPLLIAARLFRTREQLVEIARVYVGSSLLLATVGYLQMIAWYATGENPLPIGYFDALVTGKADQFRSGEIQLAELLVFRMNSFGGEPKNLGQVLVVAFLLLSLGFCTGITTISRFFATKATYLLIAIFLTLSTSAFILLFAGLLGMIALGGKAPMGMRIGRLLLLIAPAALLGFAIVSYWLDLPVIDLIAARTGQRFYASELGFLDDFDVAVVTYLANHWVALFFGVGLGNVHLFANSYLAPEVQVFAGGTSFVAKMGLLRIISETGLIGGLLLLSFVSHLLRLALRQRRDLAVGLLTIGMLTYFLVGQASLFYISAGAVIGMICTSRNSASLHSRAALT